LPEHLTSIHHYADTFAKAYAGINASSSSNSSSTTAIAATHTTNNNTSHNNNHINSSSEDEVDAPAAAASAATDDDDNINNAVVPTKLGEHGVDEVLQLAMSDSIMDAKKPGIMVLATGDANAGEFSEGFRKYVERALRHGWAVELVCWACSMSSLWTEPSWRQQWGDRFRIIALDKYLQHMQA
jgi:hypothetical protein